VYLLIPYLFYRLAHAGVPLVPSLLIVLVIAAGLGLVNGFLVAVVGVNSFIATLGTLFTFEGLTLLMTNTQEFITPGTNVLSDRLSTFASVFGGGTYSELGWAVGIVAVMQIVLRMRRWGVYTIAVGSNRLAAAEAGVPVRAVLFGNFVICSTLAGLVGILETVRDQTITPGADTTAILLSGIAAAAVGGTLLVGGSGSIIGAFVGALFLGVLQDGLLAKSVNANEFSFYVGLAILAAMTLNVCLGRARRRSSSPVAADSGGRQ
jgi:simple sugar transport system permease protein